ncbi:MAG: hotdog domain-containing protein [Pseudomonadales bacterium]|jgi:fluoroacetyl-CoA thioesterase
MNDVLVVGFEVERTYEVTAAMSPPHLPVKVLSTPSMLQLIEGTCLGGIAPHLADGETSVGTHVNISHVGPANAGERVVVKVRVAAVRKRRLTFEIEVTSPHGVISTGTHERAVIDTGRFG